MRGKGLSIGLRVLAIFAVTLWVTSIWAATSWNAKVLHNFGSGADGQYPASGLISDAAGNLYGTTIFGGDYQGGTVFELTPTANGGWTETVLHSFGNGTDGFGLYGGVIFDAAGNLYGTTVNGGPKGLGTVFELTPTAGGGWTETVLHSFGSTAKGAAYPFSGLVFDAAGNLYGTTFVGGTYYCAVLHAGCGTVFELTPTAGGVWRETVLHSFGSGADGYYLQGAGVILDAAGNVYGTTIFGGGNDCQVAQNYGCGIVFELSPNGVGGWTETVLHDFENNGTDGSGPDAALTMDAAGNLYGTTSGGGDPTCGGSGCGTVFELTPAADGSWLETVLHSFGGSPDGASPFSPLIFDPAGNLYGTTQVGGNVGIDWGTAFKLTPNGGGSWTETVLYSFCSENDCADGSLPGGSLVLDAAGSLYGTTVNGGANQCTEYFPQCGIVFKLSPTNPRAASSHVF
jgi:uncharacterized repeat protein (TIGR03803 family)